MPDLPSYPIPAVEPEKKKLVKVDKPGTMADQKGKSVRFRPLRADKRGRARKRKDDRRYVQYW